MPAALIADRSAPRDRRSEAEIAAILRGERLRPGNPSSFVRMALDHRMAALLAHAGAASLLPADAAGPLLDRARTDVVLTALQDRDVCRVLCALHDAGIGVLVMKGAHLAHSHYAQPHLRQRDDADLLIDPRDRDRAAAILLREGFQRQTDVTDDVVIGQMVFEREAAGATLDVHTRLTAQRIAADLLTFAELKASAVPLPRLCPYARGLSPVHALAVASIHQSAHHPKHDLMLWTYDTHLLVSSMSHRELDEFVTLAVERRMARICLYALREAVQYFPTPPLGSLIDRLDAVRHREPTEFLVHRRAPLSELASDLSATRGWRARMRLVLGHLFPPFAYMRRTYGVSSPEALAWCYVWRIVRGAGRWLTVKTPD